MENLNSLTKTGIALLVIFIALKLIMKTLSVLLSWGLPLIAIVLIIAGFVKNKKEY